MKRSAIALAGVLLVLAACSSDSSSSSATTTTTSSSSASSSSAPASSSSSTSAAATLSVASNAKLGQIIVDSQGRTVYLYEPDGTSATSTVPAGIKANWPPVAGSGSAVAGAGLDQSKISGTSQIAYNGHLLYTFVGDTKAGDAAGQGLGGVWFALTPAGDKIPA